MTELATVQPDALVAQQDEALGREQVELLKRTICRGTSDDEMRMFLQVCRNKKLDPFSRQIYAVKRGGSMTIQTGIDGFRAIADRTGERDGESDTQWCGEDGEWKDVWLSSKPPAAARVRIYRRGHSHPYTAIAQHSFYFQGNNPLWKKGGGAHMLAKCAEVLALRKAFPDDLAGLYSTEEMGQAENRPPSKAQALPATLDDVASEPVYDHATGEVHETIDTSRIVAAYSDAANTLELAALKRDVNEVWAVLNDEQRSELASARDEAVKRVVGETPNE